MLATKEVIAIPLHPAQPHVPGRFHEGDMEPDGYVVQLRALYFVDLACIPGLRRVGGSVTQSVMG